MERGKRGNGNRRKDRETRVRKPSNAIKPSQDQILLPKIIPQSVTFCYGDGEEGEKVKPDERQ